MCGRYSIGSDIQQIAQELHAEMPENYRPKYNAAPSQLLPVVGNTSRNKIMLYEWGIIPQWAKEGAQSKRLINARAETVHEKGTFKQPFRKRRCLVPADGYYEWKKTDQGKIPYRIILKNEHPFVFAGLWSTHQDESGGEARDFCIITTQAADNIAHIHDRMPVILEKDCWDFWLSDTEDEEGLLDILRPLDGSKLKAYVVSKRVNNVQNDSDELIKEVKSA